MLPKVNESELYPSLKYSLANNLKPLWQIGECFPGNINCKRGVEPEATDLKNVPSVTRILNETMSVLGWAGGDPRSVNNCPNMYEW